jgi:hypothetical protein
MMLTSGGSLDKFDLFCVSSEFFCHSERRINIGIIGKIDAEENVCPKDMLVRIMDGHT